MCGSKTLMVNVATKVSLTQKLKYRTALVSAFIIINLIRGIHSLETEECQTATALEIHPQAVMRRGLQGNPGFRRDLTVLIPMVTEWYTLMIGIPPPKK